MEGGEEGELSLELQRVVPVISHWVVDAGERRLS